MNQVFNIISKFNKNSVVFCNSNLNANLSHILPFIVWITLMVWVDNPVWSYNLRTFLCILIAFSLNACTSVTEGFKLKKGNNADEFLVEKKNPLVLPPDFSDLPDPNGTKVLDLTVSYIK